MRSVHHANLLPLLACFLACSPASQTGAGSAASWLWLVLPYLSGGSVMSLLQSGHPQVRERMHMHAHNADMHACMLSISPCFYVELVN